MVVRLANSPEGIVSDLIRVIFAADGNRIDSRKELAECRRDDVDE